MGTRKQVQQPAMFVEAKWRTDTVRTAEGFIKRKYLNCKFDSSISSIPSMSALQEGINAFMKRELVLTGRNDGQVQADGSAVWIDLYVKPNDPFASLNGGAS